ncbi:ethanolamine ammonia-lyase subunit EutC [Leptospira sp. 'Mane']|uniref:ethanolamine ammonia-lyase subunit EutC n=1 Tax=Leptospira sp. 'Mane' TaxID=3387407 RepID=UPI00398A766D
MGNDSSSWDKIKEHTSARIGLGRVGGSLPTKEMLKLRWDHAGARDAVWETCDWKEVIESLPNWKQTTEVGSCATTRQDYLLRPDQGRRLSEDSVSKLKSVSQQKKNYDLSICIVDGLSPLAIRKNISPFLNLLEPELKLLFKKIAPIVCITNGRVAVGDEVAEIFGAKMLIVLIGERPGLTSADSMGVYMTYEPTIGTTDERRNCISNVRMEGLSYEKAAAKLLYLLKEGIEQKRSGVLLKDRMVNSIDGGDVSFEKHLPK